jgi:circadian clock protein KaiC
MRAPPHAVPSPLARVPTGIPGLDAVLAGGWLAGDLYLLHGAPGAGKTTLANQLAFAHAAAGGRVLVATLLTETHDRLLGHLRAFAFFDPGLAGDRVRYYSFLHDLEAGGLEGLLDGLSRAVREHEATLLLVDGTRAAPDLAVGAVAGGRFLQGLQARAGLLGCTTLVLASDPANAAAAADAVQTHVDGVLALELEPHDSADARWLHVTKLRGSSYLSGRHQFVIDAAGITVFPRLEAILAPVAPPPLGRAGRRATGVAGLDAMLDGGLLSGSSTMVLGTPGAGKTLLGLHFLVDGAARGEPGLIASFHEPAATLAAAAAGIGLDLASPLAAGQIQVLWRPPFELGPDQWAAELLAAIDRQRPERMVINAYTDVGRLFAHPQRQVAFLTALTNELRAREITTLINAELDAYASTNLIPPIPAISAALDNVLLLRTAELRSQLVRICSVLKTRQSAFDQAMHEFAIGSSGLVVGDPLDVRGGLLTGQATPSDGWDDRR